MPLIAQAYVRAVRSQPIVVLSAMTRVGCRPARYPDPSEGPGSPPRSRTTAAPRSRPGSCRSPASGPTAATLIASCGVTTHQLSPVEQGNGRVRVRLQVEPPGGLRAHPTRSWPARQGRTVLEVPEDDAALLTSAAPDGSQAQGSVPVAVWPRQSDAAARAAVHPPDAPTRPAG